MAHDLKTVSGRIMSKVESIWAKLDDVDTLEEKGAILSGIANLYQAEMVERKMSDDAKRAEAMEQARKQMEEQQRVSKFGLTPNLVPRA